MNHYIATFSFVWHWRPSNPTIPQGGYGQKNTAWVPRGFGLGQRPQVREPFAWDGSEEFWQERLAERKQAGFDSVIVQANTAFTSVFQNHMRVLAADGMPMGLFIGPAAFDGRMPTLTPTSAEAILWQMISDWTDIAAAIYPLSSWMNIDGDPMIFMWSMPGDESVPDSVFVNLKARFTQRYGMVPAFSCHRQWNQVQVGSGCVEKNRLFSGTARDPIENLRGYYKHEYPHNATIRPGFLQARTGAGFIPREGGVHFEAALQCAIAEADQVERIYVESENEVVEGSHWVELDDSADLSHTQDDGHEQNINIPREDRVRVSSHPTHGDMPGTGRVPINDFYSDTDDRAHYRNALSSWAPQMRQAWQGSPPPPPPGPNRVDAFPNGSRDCQFHYAPTRELLQTAAEAQTYFDTFLNPGAPRSHGFDATLIRLEGRDPTPGQLHLADLVAQYNLMLSVRPWEEPEDGSGPPNDDLTDPNAISFAINAFSQFINIMGGTGNLVGDPAIDLQQWSTVAQVNDFIVAMREALRPLLWMPRVEDGIYYDQADILNLGTHVAPADQTVGGFNAVIDQSFADAQAHGFTWFVFGDGFRDPNNGHPDKDWPVKNQGEVGIPEARRRGVPSLWCYFIDNQNRNPGEYPNLQTIRQSNGLPPEDEEEDEDMANTWHWERNKREVIWTLPADQARDEWGASWDTNPTTGQPWGSRAMPWLLFTPNYPWEFEEVASFIGLEQGHTQEVGLAIEITDQFRGDPEDDPSTWQPVNGKNIWSRALEQHGGGTSQEAEITDYFPKGKAISTPFAIRLWYWYTGPQRFEESSEIAIVVRLRGYVRWDLEDVEPDGRTLFPPRAAAEEMGPEPYHLPCPKKEPSR